MRIVSLLPSATDIVCALGAADNLVGVSHSCDSQWQHLPVLTSTRLDLSASSADIDSEVREAGEPIYDLDIELLEALAPDVVVSQSLCDVCAVSSGDVEVAVQSVSSSPTLVNLAPFSLGDIPLGFSDVGHALSLESAADEMVQRWNDTWDSVAGRFTHRQLRVAFLDWLDPPFAAGHWIPDILELLGCESALAQSGQPSYTITWDAVRDARADIVVAACCGFTQARGERDPVPSDLQVHVLDGYEHFSRPSPNLLTSVRLLIELLERRA